MEKQKSDASGHASLFLVGGSLSKPPQVLALYHRLGDKVKDGLHGVIRVW
ncbi:MAG TPA: hypothetical protein VFD75_10735 [Pyrinomonadaceae bacterium]|nr:hypothetical protein [Pyrinomonadaceae bacterium]